jgi:hypothetical protein
MEISYNEKRDIFNADKAISNISRLRDLFFAMAEYEIGNAFKVPVEDFNAGQELVQPGIITDGTSTGRSTAATTDPGAAATGTLQWEISGSVGHWDKQGGASDGV